MKFPPQLLLILATLLWGGNFVIGRAVSGDIPSDYSCFFTMDCRLSRVFPYRLPTYEKRMAITETALGCRHCFSTYRSCCV